MSLSLPKVLLDTKLHPDFQSKLEKVCLPIPWSVLETGDEETLKEITGIFTQLHPRVDMRVMSKLPNLKVISNQGVGVDHIDLKVAAERQVLVGNTPSCLDDTTADMAFALLLASARKIVQGHQISTSPNTISFDPFWYGEQVSFKTIGIIGMGRIGSKIAQRAKGFSMRILYHSRNRYPEKEKELQVEYRDIHSLLTHSDFVVVAVPLTAETTHMIGRMEFSLMKRNAIFVNISRGAVIDQNALVVALQNESIKGAALDVTDPEPLPRDHPLLSMPQVTISPHTGTATMYARQKMADNAIENLKLGLSDQPLRWPVK